LNDQGHTILLITHDHEVAAQAKRIVEIRDGLIISDREQPAPEAIVPPVTPPMPPKRPQRGRGSGYGLLDVTEACRMAVQALRSNLLRTLLTLLGIIRSEE